MSLAYDNFVKLAMRETAETPDDFLRVKKNICKKLKIQPPTNADIREAYEKLIAEKRFKRNLTFEKLLISKKMRTQSGVAVIAVLINAFVAGKSAEIIILQTCPQLLQCCRRDRSTSAWARN